MKRILTLCVVGLLLVGCSDARVQVTTNETLLTVNGQKVTQQDLFNVMKSSDRGAAIISHSSKALVKGVSDPSIDQKVQEQLKQVKEYFTTLKQDFAEYLKTMDYESEQAYIDNELYPQYALNFLVEGKIKEDYAKIAEEYKPVKARILQTETIAKAQEALKRVKDGESFDVVGKDLAAEKATYVGETKVYSIKNTQFPAPVSTFITTQKAPGLSDVLTVEGTEVSYIVEIIETQADRVKDEAVEGFLKDTTLTQSYVAKLFAENGFKVFDKDIHTIIEENFKDYLSK